MHPKFPSDHGDGRVGGHRHKSIHRLLGGGRGTLLFCSFWEYRLSHLPASLWFPSEFRTDVLMDPTVCLCLAAADILLWNDRNLSAGVLAGATLIWYLFEVVEYNIIPLLCQIAVLAMLLIFIWSNAAPILDMYDFPSLKRELQDSWLTEISHDTKAQEA